MPVLQMKGSGRSYCSAFQMHYFLGPPVSLAGSLVLLCHLLGGSVTLEGKLEGTLASLPRRFSFFSPFCHVSLFSPMGGMGFHDIILILSSDFLPDALTW